MNSISILLYVDILFQTGKQLRTRPGPKIVYCKIYRSIEVKYVLIKDS